MKFFCTKIIMRNQLRDFAEGFVTMKYFTKRSVGRRSRRGGGSSGSSSCYSGREHNHNLMLENGELHGDKEWRANSIQAD